MPALVILGASGFLGRALIERRPPSMLMKAVARHVPDARPPEGVSWHKVDLTAPAALDDVLQAGDVVCNLAYMLDAGSHSNIALIDNVVDSCVRRQASRLVHCSTAVVAGAITDSRVTEATGSNPLTEYEKTKWLVEQRAVSATAKGLDVAILRPTAIVGPGGQNLVGLASSLLDGNPVANYFRASLFGRRAMHLVPVRNVAAALLHLAGLPHPLGGNIYQVSADDDPRNDFRSIEALLCQCLGVRPRAIPLLPLPPQLLSLLLRLLGRSDTDLHRRYDSGKLLATGFRPVDSVPDAVGQFAANFRQQRQAAQPAAVSSLRP